jgi:adenylate cyclase
MATMAAFDAERELSLLHDKREDSRRRRFTVVASAPEHAGRPAVAVERRLAAILAADVVGYSRLMGADEVATLGALKARWQEVLEPLVGRYQGRVFKYAGDGVLAEFSSAVNAVQCAVELQRDMGSANLDEPENRRIVLRIGVNLGDVIVEGSDLYGDGVNIAARLEQAADPGGIMISGAAYDQVKNKIDESFDDAGVRRLKNIGEPVRVYRVGGVADVAAATSATDRPSIAVLPFINVGGDPAHEYFTEGITQNIITGLSRFRDLSVVASSSSFAYRGKTVKIQDASRDLGARYVLEGSVQRAGVCLRITAQLIDGATGRHLWAERYDRGLEDIFAVQDDVSELIVGTLAAAYGGRLGKAWQGRAEGTGTRNLRALDHFLRGMDLMHRCTREDNERARESFAKAARLDPSYAKPIAEMSWSHMIDAYLGWSANAPQSWAEALRLAKLAIERDDEEAWGHHAFAGYCMYKSQHCRAIAEFERALALNPNDADTIVDFALCLSYAGRSAQGLEMALKAMRLNPHHPEFYAMQLGQICFNDRRYEKAVDTLEGLRSMDTVLGHLYLAASHAALGHGDHARAAVKRVMDLDPQATIERWACPEMAPYKEAQDSTHFRENLRKAGLPE